LGSQAPVSLANAFGELLEPGRARNCYLGQLLPRFRPASPRTQPQTRQPTVWP